jgi:hypothetical protein
MEDEMARKKPVALETISFDTQTLALTFFHEMLQKYVPGEQVTPEDTIHLVELFKRHPSYLTKVGPGVNYFEVMPEQFSSQCFCAVLMDGTKEGFSYKKCVTQKGD